MRAVAFVLILAGTTAGVVWAQDDAGTDTNPESEPAAIAAEQPAQEEGGGRALGAGRGHRGLRQGPPEFVDADGDGINDLAPDADGDGIPNRLDEDYVREPASDGSGRALGAGRGHRGLANGADADQSPAATEANARRQGRRGGVLGSAGSSDAGAAADADASAAAGNGAGRGGRGRGGRGRK